MLLLVAAFLWQPISGGKALLPGDYLKGMSPWNSSASSALPQWNALQWDALAEFYPWRVFYADSIRHGVLPLWNPHQFSGTPFAANGQSAVFYPLSLIFVLFGPKAGFTASAFLHLFLAGAFTFMLARRLGIGAHSSTIAAITYTFSAYMVVWLELPTFVNVAAWLPLVLLLSHIAVKQRSSSAAAGSGVAAGLCVLAGHLQVALYCWIAGGMWWSGLIWMRRNDKARIRYALRCAAIAAAIAVLISSVQIIPSVEFARASHRTRTVSAEGYAQFVQNGIPAIKLITALVPNFYGTPAGSSYWLGDAALYTEHSFYVGILSVLLAVIGTIYAFRRRGSPVFFATMAIVSLLLAFGTPLNAVFYYLVPGMSALGGPNRITVLYSFAAAMLAGFGADWLAGACARPDSPACDRESGFPSWAVVVAVGSVALLFILGWFTAGAGLIALLGSDTAQAAYVKARPAVALFAVLFTCSMVILFIRSSGGLDRKLFLRLGIAVIVMDLFVFGVNYNPTTPYKSVYPETRGVKELRRWAGDDRIAVINPRWSLYQVPKAVFPPNSAMIYGLKDIGGYDSLFLRSYKNRVDGIFETDCSPMENGNMIFAKYYAPRIAEMARVVVSARPIDDPTLHERYRGEFYIYRTDERVPKAKSRQEWSNPNSTVSCDVGISGWQHDGSAYCYRPHSIRLGMFLMLFGIAGSVGLGVRELTMRRKVI